MGDHLYMLRPEFSDMRDTTVQLSGDGTMLTLDGLTFTRQQ